MKNFCIYNGKKIVKPDIWNITSIELSGDYTSAIIQSESEANTSQHTLDVTPLISNQYKNDIDPYSTTIVNGLTGVDNWVFDSDNNQITYVEPIDPESGDVGQYLWGNPNVSNQSWDSWLEACQQVGAIKGYATPVSTARYNNDGKYYCSFNGWLGTTVNKSANPTYDSEAAEEERTKSIPLDVVVQQVISNAQSGNTDAQQVILSTVFSPTLVSSLSDSDMQQWQAVEDAIGGLTGATEWTFDNADKVVRYQDPNDQDLLLPNNPIIYTLNYDAPNIHGRYTTAEEVCNKKEMMGVYPHWETFIDRGLIIRGGYCVIDPNALNSAYPLPTGISNPNYNPSYVAPTVTITYQQIADKIIDNSNVADQGVSLLAETYIQEAFLKFTDVDSLSSQFEQNKQPKQ